MNTKQMIKNIEKIVCNACKKKANFFGCAIWYTHFLPVVKYAKIMAEKLGADKEIV